MPHRFIRELESFRPSLGVTDVVGKVDFAGIKFSYALGETVALDVLDLPSRVEANRLNVIEDVTGHRLVVGVHHHQAIVFLIGDTNDLLFAFLTAEKDSRQKQQRRADDQDRPEKHLPR